MLDTCETGNKNIEACSANSLILKNYIQIQNSFYSYRPLQALTNSRDSNMILLPVHKGADQKGEERQETPW